MLEILLFFLILVGIAQIVNAIGNFVGPRVTRARWAVLDAVHLSRMSPVPCSICQGYGEIETFKGMTRCPECNAYDPLSAAEVEYGRPHDPEFLAA